MPTTRRYALAAAFVAVLACLATVLLGMLATTMTATASTTVRLDSRRVHGSGARAAPITFAVAPMTSPRHAFAHWSAFAEYLGSKVGRDVVVVQRRDLKEMSDLVERGEAQVALLCSEPYVRLRRRGLASLLAMPRVRGGTMTRSLVIVPAASPYRTIDDLRGRRFAFTDPLSNPGCLYPTWLLRTKGLAPSEFFGQVVYTRSHDRSILAVANGLLDGAAVHEAVLEDVKSHDPGVGERLRVVQASPPFGLDPVVASTKASPALVESLRRALLGARDDVAGRALLLRLDLEGFEPGDPEAYRVVETELDGVER